MNRRVQFVQGVPHGVLYVAVVFERIQRALGYPPTVCGHRDVERETLLRQKAIKAKYATY